MVESVNILAARSGDDDWMKIVFGVGAVIVWGLFQLTGALAKKADDAKRRRQYGQMPEDVRPYGYGGVATPPPPPVPSGLKPSRQPQPQQQGKRKGNGGRGKGGGKRAQAAAVAEAARAAQQLAAATAQQEYEASRAAAAAARPDEEDAHVRRPVRAAAPAGQIGRLLRRPDSLRAALILNEVMAKPVALRDEGLR